MEGTSRTYGDLHQEACAKANKLHELGHFSLARDYTYDIGNCENKDDLIRIIREMQALIAKFKRMYPWETQ